MCVRRWGLCPSESCSALEAELSPRSLSLATPPASPLHMLCALAQDRLPSAGRFQSCSLSQAVPEAAFAVLSPSLLAHAAAAGDCPGNLQGTAVTPQ